MAEEQNDEDDYDETEILEGGSSVGSMTANRMLRVIGLILGVLLVIIAFV